jgi:aryl-alcohol dehydrogenase-like predicted oxidoreductase
LAFLAWQPLALGALANPKEPLARIAAAHHATPAQIALAWLLHRSAMLLPIPGTTSARHLEENVAAARLSLTGDESAMLAEQPFPGCLP